MEVSQESEEQDNGYEHAHQSTAPIEGGAHRDEEVLKDALKGRG